MSEQGHLAADHDDQFEREMRGYSRRAVDEYVASLRIDLRGLEDGKRDLEDRLSRALDENERLKLELSSARSAGRPPHEEISERIGQILKLADDEANAQRKRADEEIVKLRNDAVAETTKLRGDVKAETDRNRAEAHEQAERMLSAAQEQADATTASARTEAETTRSSAAKQAQQVIADAAKQADNALSSAKAEAKTQLDEATARATAIHDGAERRLNLLMSRHTEAIRRLTEIRDVAISLVAGEVERGSLDDEVAKSVATAMGAQDSKSQQAAGRGAAPASGQAEGRHASQVGIAAPAHRSAAPAVSGSMAAPLAGNGSPAPGNSAAARPAAPDAGPDSPNRGSQANPAVVRQPQPAQSPVTQQGNGQDGAQRGTPATGRVSDGDDTATGLKAVRD